MPVIPYVIPDGAELAAVRESLDLSQSKLAKQAGVGRETISRIESGATNAVMPRTIVRLAKALRVSRERLLIDPEEEDGNVGRRADERLFVAINGRLVAAHRKTQLMSQGELARRASCSRATIAKIERSIPELPCRVMPVTLKRIAKALKRDSGSLIDTENQPDYLQDYYEAESVI